MIGTRTAYPEEPWQAATWFSALQWAIDEPTIIAQFEEATGQTWIFNHNRSPLDKSIDRATGREEALVDIFVDWFNLNVWGEDPFSHAKTEEAELPTLPGKTVQ